MSGPPWPPELLDRATQALAVPLQAALGATPLDPADPPAGVTFTVGDLAGNGAGGLHAAALSAVIECSGYLAVLPTLAADEHAVTHAISSQFLAAAGAGERVEVRATLDRRTKRLAFLNVEARTGTALLARSQLTKSIITLR